MNDENDMVAGLYYYPPHEKAPDFVIADLSMQRERLIGWLNAQQVDEKGYIKIQILRSQAGKPYAKLNNYKKDASRTSPSGQGGQNGERNTSTRDESTKRVADAFGAPDELTKGTEVDDLPF